MVPPIQLRLFRAQAGGSADSGRAAPCHALHVSVSTVERRRFRARGVVQGVGFRPFVHRLACARGLSGFVLNDGEGVVIEAEGAARARRVRGRVVEAAPGLARVESLAAEQVPPCGGHEFEIRTSLGAAAVSAAAAIVPPDVATCDDCLPRAVDLRPTAATATRS